jgi:hypothetical protein
MIVMRFLVGQVAALVSYLLFRSRYFQRALDLGESVFAAIYSQQQKRVISTF